MLNADGRRLNRHRIETPFRRTGGVVLAVVAGTASVAFDDAYAQPAYPVKPVRIVVTNLPGGTSDFFARVIGKTITDATQQPVLVDNRPGGSGRIAAEAVARAAPDGYTLFLGGATALTVNPSLFPDLSYDSMKDFAPISMIALFPSLLVSHPSLPVRNVKELIALAKARPGELSYASTGAGQTSHLGMELLKTMGKVDIYHIPYKASVAALVDLIGGRLSVMLATVPAGLPHIKSGRLRALAVTSLKRTPVLPDLPSVAESGLPGYEITLWHGMYSAAGTPDAIISKLNTLVVQALQDPEVRKKLLNEGAEPLGSTPQRVTEQMKLDMVKWRKVIQASGAKPE
jgi:tripartite-type tricarboxylate transporter receptor subunit TctC